MIHPEGCGILLQAMPDAILKCPAHPFYLPIGFAFENDDMIMDDAQPFTELCKATRRLSAIIYLDLAWLAPMANQIIIQKLGSPPAV